MALVDPNFEQHRQTWLGFTRVVRYAMAVIVLILIGLAIFTLGRGGAPRSPLDALASEGRAALPAARAMTKTKKSENDKVPSHHSCHMPYVAKQPINAIVRLAPAAAANSGGH